MFICLDCQSSFTTDSVLSHLKREHTRLSLKPRELKINLENIAKVANIAAELPTIEGTVPAFAGLKVHKSTGCPFCPYAASLRVVQNHMNQKHPSMTGVPMMDISVQVLNSGISKSYFRVVIPVEQGCTIQSKLVQELVEFDWKATSGQNSADLNARMISPWLMRTGWHLYADGKDPKQLKAYVSMPQQGEFDGLHTNILEYCDYATNLMDSTDELVLQRINTSDPTKE